MDGGGFVLGVRRQASDERLMRFQSRMQYVGLILRHHSLPHDLVKRVNSYLDYQFRCRPPCT